MACRNCTSNGCQCVVIGDGIVTVTGAGDILSPYIVESDPCVWVQGLSPGTFISGSTEVLIRAGGGCSVATITIPGAVDLCEELNALDLGTFTQGISLVPVINEGVCEVATLTISEWIEYIPTFTGVTVGSGFVGGQWTQIGDTVHFEAIFSFGSGSAVTGPVTVTLPATVAINSRNIHSIFHVAYLDSNVPSVYSGICRYLTSTTIGLSAANSAGTYVSPTALSSSIPFTWASGDTITVSGTYSV